MDKHLDNMSLQNCQLFIGFIQNNSSGDRVCVFSANQSVQSITEHVEIQDMPSNSELSNSA